jgi:hypothetical protein
MSDPIKKPQGGTKSRDLIVGIVVGLITNAIYDIGKAVLIGGLPNLQLNLNFKLAAMLLSPVGGFFVGGLIAGVIELTGTTRIEWGSRMSWAMIAIGTVVSYLILSRLF